MQEFLAKRASLIASATPGRAAARELCELTDEAVRELSRAASPLIGERWAIVALGGWGAGGLLPASDLDLLVLCDAPESGVKPFVEAVLYPLWDAGLKVGHQVRTARQQRRAMADDLKTCTAALTARPLAGDTAWADGVIAACATDARRRRRRLLADLADRPRPGSPFLLDADLKEGAGGRRDRDELAWTAAALEGAARAPLAALSAHGVLDDDELDALDGATETIAALRWRLHAAGLGDTLSDEAGAVLGALAEDAHAAMGVTALLLARARARLTRRDPLGVCTLDPLAPDETLASLGSGTAALASLEHAAVAGRLDHLVPGFADLMAARRPGLGHRLTVGAHCLLAAALTSDPVGDSSLAASQRAAGPSPVVRVAALVHDAAKIDGGAGHAERGAPAARETALRFGLDEDDATACADLVRLHLVLVETATREDLDHEDAILRCAARVGRRELLAPLHLLTAVDSLATGPSTWSPWMSALVGTLVARLDAALSPDVDGAGIAAHGEAVRNAALSGLDTSSRAATFVRAAPLRYLASRTTAEVLRDASLVADLEADGDPRVRAVGVGITPGDVERTFTVTVAAHDRPELLARLAGALALAGLDILSVDAYGAPGGIALDSFVVRSATGASVTRRTLDGFGALAASALEDRFELANRLAERRRHYPRRAQAPSRVEVAPSGWDTTVVVETPDRPGLFHDLAAAVSATGLDIRWARAQTVSGVALDTFHVTGPDGGPVDDPGVLGHLSMRLREAV